LSSFIEATSTRSIIQSLSDARKFAKECADTKAAQHSRKDISAIEEVLADLNTYLQLRRGTYERVLVEKIIETVINCKHNPFYGGSFNGNICARLLEGYTLLFKAIRDAGRDTEPDVTVRKNLDSVIDRHENIFMHFAQVYPNFRSTRLLDEFEREELLESIKLFWEAYITSSGSGSVTTKIHFLVHHTAQMLNLYGTIGFFAEDSMESIHAIVNELAYQFASLDKSRKCTQILRVLAARKTQAMEDDVKEKAKAGERAGKKRKRRQGENAKLTTETATVAVDQEMQDAISHFIGKCGKYDACEPMESSGETRSTESNPRARSAATFVPVSLDDDCGIELTFPTEFNMVCCAKCRAILDIDVTVPDVLVPLYDVLVHGYVGGMM